MDLGTEGLEQTIALLRQEGIVTFGAGRNEEEAARPVRIDGEVPLALIGYSMRCRANASGSHPGSAPFRFGVAVESIRALASEGRQVLIHLHMGRMYLRRPSPRHLRVARGLLDAGAAIVLCHHSHVPAGVLGARGRCAALGLGDFLFDAYQGEIRTIVGRRSRTVGVLFRADLTESGLARWDCLPLLLPKSGGAIPHPRASRIMQQWRRWDRELRLPHRAYTGVYYALEYPRLLVYIGHAALIHACRRNWGKVYDYTLGLLARRRHRGRRGAESEY
jgi:poly-gamma-glutamate synthesis protein (capsule biosynthesis protein)